MTLPINNQQFNQFLQNSGTHPSMGFTTPSQIQNIDASTLANGITQNSILKGVNTGEEEDKSLVTTILTFPVAAALIHFVGKFNAACRGTEYETSLLGKGAKLGDNISEKLKVVEPFMNKVYEGAKFLDNNLVSRSKILSAFFHAQSKPTNSMVLTMGGGTKTELASDAIGRLEKYVENGNNLLKSDGSAYSKEEAKTMLKEISGASYKDENIKKIVDICKAQGNAATEETKIFKIKNIPIVGNLFKNSSKEYLSDYISPLKSLGRKVYFSEYVNKIETFTNPHGKTFLGRLVPRAMIRCLEGLTNGTAAGKIAVLMGAYFVAEAIKKGYDAPKGETIKTAAEELTYNMGWYLTMPLALKLMHSVGGLQYIGMGKGKENITQSLKDYRAKLAEFNDMAMGKDGKSFANKAEYDAASKELCKMLKGASEVSFTKPSSWLNILAKPFKLAGKALTIGLETKHPYVDGAKVLTSAGKISNLLKSIPYKFKKAAGYPMRFGMFMFLFSPPLAEIGAKASHLIFGRPTKSVLDDEDSEKKNRVYPPLIMPQQDGVAKQTASDVLLDKDVSSQNVSPNQVLPNQVSQNQVLPNQVSQNNSSQVPSEVQNGKPKRTYIPSSAAVQIDPRSEYAQREAELARLLQQSMYAEKSVSKFVKEKN